MLIDFRVWKDAMVWPMVAAGASNNEVAYRPGTQPLLHKASTMVTRRDGTVVKE